MPAPAGYRILEELQRGAQGTVFRAEQVATRRTVALKILHAGRFASRLQRTRFEREVELLAQLRHPSVVAVHDSGAMPDGGSYIALEFVDGDPIDRAVRNAFDPTTRRGLRELVRLLIQVCEGVAFLHQHGIIHRDLKPANILIDSTGQPRIVDFGLARLQSTGLTEESATLDGEFAGTLAYAAPEQTAGDPSALDVRTDVYALGVIFYELLAGTSPYSTQGSLSDILHRINEAIPAPPCAAGPAWSDRELDNILLKALAKDKDQRYDSAAALARDLRRWHDGLPVEAVPPGFWYMLRKAVVRHRLVFSLGAATLLLLAGFALSMSLAYRRASLEAAKANQIRIFLEDTLASVSPGADGGDVTVRQTLDEAVHWVAIALGDQPEIAASLHLTIGNSYRALGRHQEAEEQVRQAIALYGERFGDQDPQMVRAHASLALVLRDGGELNAARDLLEDCLERLAAQVGRDDVQLTNMMMNLAGIHLQLGDTARAQEGYQEALSIRQRALGPGHPDTAMCLYRLGELHAAAGRPDRARELHERALQIRTAALHAEHPDIARSQNALERLPRP